MRHVALAVAIASTLLCSAEAQAGEICDQLREFENSIFDRSLEPTGRRWFEMRWEGQWLGDEWTLACTRSGGGVAPELCQYLVEHSSFEFSSALPIRILECHGHVFPDHTDWSDWSAGISFWRADRLSILEINLVRSNDHVPTIRYSVFDSGVDDVLAELPPI